MQNKSVRDRNISRVIQTAQQLFVEEGVAATSINRIAKEAGLAPMSVYRYFGSKDKLVIEVWKDALPVFYSGFMQRYLERTKDMKTGFEKYVACMDEYTDTYARYPRWYAYTREMLSYAMEESDGDGVDMRAVFWQFCDNEIPIPALAALREGIEDGSIKPDIDIHLIYQILVNAYTGTNIYKGTDIDIDPVEILRLSSEFIAKSIKNEA